MKFPTKIKYVDNNEIVQVEKPEDIKKYKVFVIEKTIKWGRK